MARKSKKALAMVAVGLTPAAIIITGCGGGEGGHSVVSASNQAAERGVLTLKVTFPKRRSKSAGAKGRHPRVGRPVAAYDGSIPEGTFSVKVALLNPATGAPLALPQTILAPEFSEGEGVSSPQFVSFTNLPVGPVRVQVMAFPTLLTDTAQGPGEANPIAIGAADAQIVANQTVAARVLLQLTIDHVTLVPKATLLRRFLGENSVVLTAQAFDKNNAPLIYPFTFATSNPDAADVNPLDAQHVEVDGNNTGTATITATEINSMMTATATVTVDNGP